MLLRIGLARWKNQMFTELEVLRAGQSGATWKRENVADFDQLVVLCRQLEKKGYFELAEKQTARSGSMAPEMVTIHALRQAGETHLREMLR